jgi:hypothetical protein
MPEAAGYCSTPMKHLRRALAFTVAGLLSGCASDSTRSGGEAGSGASESAPESPPGIALGGQTGGEAGIRCTSETPVEPLALDAPSPLGFSAAEIFQTLRSEYSGVLTYTDGSSTELTISIHYDGSAGYARNCRSNQALVVVNVSTADAALGESLHAPLFARSADTATVQIDLSPDAIAGSLRATRPDVAALSQLSFDISFDPLAAHGSLTGVTASDAGASDTLSIATF